MSPIHLPSLRTLWPVALAGAWFALSLASFFPAPHAALWKVRVATTEFGHFLVALPLLTLPLVRHSSAAVALCLLASVLLLSTLPQAAWTARALPAQLDAAFPDSPEPRGTSDAPALGAPFAWGSLLGLASPGVKVETLQVQGADGGPLPVDLYTRDSTPSPRPLVLVVHGGSWNSGDRTQLPALNRHLAARGYAVAAVSYRLAPEHVHPAALEDIVAVVEGLWGRADELNLDPAQTLLAGRSAGGHLALLAGYRLGRDRIRGVVAYYPPTDMVWSWNHPTNPRVLDTPAVLGDFLGGPLQAQPARYRDASPLEHVSAKSPPTLLIHGHSDELVFPKQSQRLDAALRAASVPSFALLLPWATHGCEANLAGPSGQLSTYAIERFLAFALAPDEDRPGAPGPTRDP